MADLKKLCKTELNLKIISFFHENPATVDTVRGITAWLNHNREQMQKALDYLVRQKILISHRTGSTAAYGYTQNKKVVKEIGRFLRYRKVLCIYHCEKSQKVIADPE